MIITVINKAASKMKESRIIPRIIGTSSKRRPIKFQYRSNGGNLYNEDGKAFLRECRTRTLPTDHRNPEVQQYQPTINSHYFWTPALLLRFEAQIRIANGTSDSVTTLNLLNEGTALHTGHPVTRSHLILNGDNQ